MTGIAPERPDLAVARVLAGGLDDTRTPATPVCPNCLDFGCACESHPDRPWEGTVAPPAGCDCGAPGIPCPTCCDPIPQDGTHSIADAFTPRHLRT